MLATVLDDHPGLTCAPAPWPRTIGPLVDEPAATALGATDRALIARWREERWSALERRAGTLAARDPAQWYELLVFERWRSDQGTRGLPSFVLELFYAIKRFIPRSVQLGRAGG